MRWLVGLELTRFRERRAEDRSKRRGDQLLTGEDRPHGVGPQPATARRGAGICGFYGADQADIDRLASLAGSAGEQTWWGPWTEVVPDWLETFVGLEGLATRASGTRHWFFPALLQTASTTPGVTVNIRVRPDHNERMVSLRDGNASAGCSTRPSRSP